VPAQQNNRSQQTARENSSKQASFTQHDLAHPFAQGSFRWVAKGHYTSGARNGEPCVCKWFKTGGVMEASFYALDIKAMEKSMDLIRHFNAEGLIDRVVRLNRPEVWTFSSGPREGQKVMQEPFVQGYQKFNSNSGWKDHGLGWSEVMQALSHYSYHKSGGQFVLCDLQGGVYSDGVVLTDPVILSRTQKYGPTDLGPEGISSFFSRHVCNEYCRAHWQKPNDMTAYHAANQGTSMLAVQARPSRPQMSMFAQMASFQEEDEYSDESDCISGGTPVRMGDGGQKAAHLLRAGDVVYSPALGAATAIVATLRGGRGGSTAGAGVPMVSLPGGGWITAEHPMRPFATGQWAKPSALAAVQLRGETCLCNFVLAGGHSIEAGGVEVATMGHDSELGISPPHDFYGAEGRVLSTMRALPGWPDVVLLRGSLLSEAEAAAGPPRL
jgi:hypothetical protein